ncbi:DUF6382 domain-containing protein [Parablautia intestinalis]|jgi:hypothetical protein|uniref:DUF6382 domain-containing protein n=1 Tax=Parablautia intestinalis TaxID=2320100 RepID=UPI00256F31D8|nr:DUF6382 domain-containing protein [Parablautia intestinalis]MCI8615134.1 FHA domain-containing protein [Lachnospiraceae bacterium]
MLDVKYYKDYRHNYLIIKDDGSLSEYVYQRKMMTENTIKGLLNCQERFINGEILLYYEITSRQSLFHIFDGKGIGIDELGSFFVQLKVVNDMLQKYLLDGSCLALSPEYIFQNIETGEYSFLYYPGSDEGSLSKLMDFFISKVDGEDMEAVEAVYKIADLINREQFVLDEVLRWFQDDISQRKKDNYFPYEMQFQNQKLSDQNQSDQAQRSGYRRESLDEEEGGNGEGKEPYESVMSQTFPEEKDAKEITRDFKKALPVLGIGISGAGILTYVMYFYQLSYKEEIYIIAGWVLMAVLILGAILWYLHPLLNRKKKIQEQEDTERERYYTPAYENNETVSDTDIGNTVFIPWTESYENKLYSMDKKIKCHIDLGSLPLTVGKLAGAVDMVIDEKSISRMHAKFFRDGNKIYISDLNSTNGTFRNGMRLAPNASEMIEPGDEIRLGKLKFIYR